MQVVSLADKAHGTIPRRSDKKNGPHLHKSIGSLPKSAHILFFSQRWLRKEHPDDEQGSKHAGVASAARAWAAIEKVDETDVYVWFDFCSVEQDDFTEMVACINALAFTLHVVTPLSRLSTQSIGGEHGASLSSCSVTRYVCRAMKSRRRLESSNP